METREQRRQKAKEILEYVYDQVRVKDSDQEYLLEEWDFDDVRKLRRLTEEDFNTMKEPSENNSGRRLINKIRNVVS